jgi:hypothetical protein
MPRTPFELLGKEQVGRRFLEPVEADLEAAGGGRTARGIDGQRGSPNPMLIPYL